MPTMSAVPTDHPMMKAWIDYQATDDYKNTAKWAPTHTSGSLWAAFERGWTAAEAQRAYPGGHTKAEWDVIAKASFDRAAHLPSD